MPIANVADTLLDRFHTALAVSPSRQTETIGLCVSGGGDSIAMLHMAARARASRNFKVLTVDHGLRSEAKDEIALVAAQAETLGLDHTVVEWRWDGTGNLQAEARAGRWAAALHWAATHNLREIWLGHTEDDQVETVLMRLARGSGIDGLTAMYQSSQRDGLRVFRPLLGIGRDELRAWLNAQDIDWCDDPSNDDPRFDRVRARQMFDQLETLGLTCKRLLQTVIICKRHIFRCNLRRINSQNNISVKMRAIC